jgi:hypothetical protein
MNIESERKTVEAQASHPDMHPMTEHDVDVAADEATLLQYTPDQLKGMTEEALDDFLNNTLKTDTGREQAAKMLGLDEMMI